MALWSATRRLSRPVPSKVPNSPTSKSDDAVAAQALDLRQDVARLSEDLVRVARKGSAARGRCSDGWGRVGSRRPRASPQRCRLERAQAAQARVSRRSGGHPPRAGRTRTPSALPPPYVRLQPGVCPRARGARPCRAPHSHAQGPAPMGSDVRHSRGVRLTLLEFKEPDHGAWLVERRGPSPAAVRAAVTVAVDVAA
jgi:hypothetical protein